MGKKRVQFFFIKGACVYRAFVFHQMNSERRWTKFDKHDTLMLTNVLERSYYLRKTLW